MNTISNEAKRKAPAADNNIVDAMVRIDGGIAPVIYWILTTLAMLIVLLDAYLVVALRQDGDRWGSVAAAGLAIGAGAALVYVLGWGWRWVFTRRTDHLFGQVKCSSETKEPLRKRLAQILEIGSWFW